MEKKQNLFGKLLSLITYKKINKPKEFVLEETDEKQEAQLTKSPQQASSGSGEREEAAEGSGKTAGGSEGKAGGTGPTTGEFGRAAGEPGTKKGKKYLRKPLTAGEMRSQRTDSDEVKTDIRSNLQVIKEQFTSAKNKDLVLREFTLGRSRRAFIVYIDGMADKNTIDNFILRPLFEKPDFLENGAGQSQNPDLENIVQTNDIKKLTSIKKVVAEVLKGNTALYIDGLDYFLTCETIGFEKRGVEAPKTEGIVKGSQEAFGESLRTNITLLRRIIRNKELISEFFEIGEKSGTTVAVVYLQNVINPAIVTEIRRRLTGIKTDFLANSGALEQFIEDNPYSIVPTTLSTERPDRTAAQIMEGRAAIIVDGSPLAIIVPVTFNEMMHSPEDTSLKWQYTTGLRFIRFVAVALGALLPGIYLAMTCFHREMIPTDLLIAIAKAKENVPFPALLEVLLMELGFELIREAGIRIPGIIGNTLGIIGALILGEAAVSANIVSPVLIIIVAATGLSNFAIPNYSMAFGVRLLRFYFIIAGSLLGFYGMALALIALTLMLVNLKSFGVPFMSIVAPRNLKSKDAVIRWPVWMQEQRPDYLNPLERRRQPEVSRQWAQEDAEDSKKSGSIESGNSGGEGGSDDQRR